MMYGWSNLWIVAVGGTAVTLLPLAALCCALAAARPIPRPLLDACALVAGAGAFGAATVGVVTTARSLAAMRAAAALVDPTTARELWALGWPEALLPAATSVALAGALVVTMRTARALDRHRRGACPA